VVGIERPAKENVRDRILGDDEIRAFWRATDDLPAPFNDIYKLLLLSCARRQEVAEARWGEVDLINKVWVISAKRAKGKAAVALPLGPLAWSIIERQPRIAGSDYVFGRRRCGFSHMKRQLDAIMKPTVQWQNHDLRRSGRSLLSKARVPVGFTIGLNTSARSEPGLQRSNARSIGSSIRPTPTSFRCGADHGPQGEHSRAEGPPALTNRALPSRFSVPIP
jgi:integrase